MDLEEYKNEVVAKITAPNFEGGVEGLRKILVKHWMWLYDVEGGERAHLTYANLIHANLSCADLSDADLSYANLVGADLSYANLSDANLRYANLVDANLIHANLSCADLSDANLIHANLSCADLSDANLVGADLSYAHLTGADLSDANLSGAIRAEVDKENKKPVVEPVKKMSAVEFQKETTRTCKEKAAFTISPELLDMLHTAMGLETEAGEFTDQLKKHIFYGKELDMVNLQEEIGDILWYIGMFCERLGFSMEQIMAQNIAKLKVRYPDKFTEQNAEARDLKKERIVLEQTSQI